MSAEDSFGLIDAAIWVLTTALALSLTPMGSVCGDALVHSSNYARGTWFWNPNHLLLEPVGAWWQATLSRLGTTRLGVDQLKILSILSGAIALGVTRWGLAGPLAHSRAAANLATAWVAFSSGFSSMWISGYPVMLQMPFLVLGGVAVVWYFHRPSWITAVTIGSAVGASVLFYVSNILIAASLGLVIGIWHCSRREWRYSFRALLGIGIGVACVAGVVFVFTWMVVSSPNTGIVEWLTTYAGGRVSTRATAAYRVELSISGMAIAVARALYGSARNIVEIAPIVQIVRDEEDVTFITGLNLMAFAAACVMVIAAVTHAVRGRNDPRNMTALLLTAAWTLGVLSFGIYFDKSEPFHYFQLGVPIAALVATVPLQRGQQLGALVLLSCLAIGWNVWDITNRHILYPRTERLKMLESIVAGAGLIVYPGWDEVDDLLSLANTIQERRLSIMSLAERYDPKVGLDQLEAQVREHVNRGERISVVSIFDVPALKTPWKFLRKLGYDQSDVRARLKRFAIEQESTPIGPFTVRLILPLEEMAP